MTIGDAGMPAAYFKRYQAGTVIALLRCESSIRIDVIQWLLRWALIHWFMPTCAPRTSRTYAVDTTIGKNGLMCLISLSTP